MLPPPPGNERLGRYSIAAEPVRGLPDGGIGELLEDGGLGCALPEVSPTSLRFEAQVTRDSSTAQAWLTLGPGYPRDAGWDGQLLDSTASVRRLFPSCGACSGVQATESIRFVLLSRSQSEVVGRRCPDNALDGGTPLPNADAGVTPPRQTPEGFDALYACGELVFSVQASQVEGGEPCPSICSECVVRYTLQGERR